MPNRKTRNIERNPIMEITAKQVKELRDATNVSMMECKRALQETSGDLEAAIKKLRERGAAVAAKRADRDAKEGKITAVVTEDLQRAAMIEVNCETDFVTRNEGFQSFVDALLGRALDYETGAMEEAVKAEVAEKIAAIGEKIQLRRNVTWTATAPGMIASYVHLGGKVGVFVEMGCEKTESVNSPVLAELAKDITLHVAAAAPQYLCREEVPAAEIEAEREIYAKQVEGKPANIIDNIVNGKVNKFFSQICLLEQGFVKDDKISITALVEAKNKELGDKISIRRYLRWQLGA